MNNELLPCPFCGGAGKEENGFLPCESTMYAFCSNLDCYLHNIDVGMNAEAWNQRTQQSAQPADALVEALEEVTASLEWNAHGICRGINDGPIMPSSMAVEFAKEAIATYRAAQEKK